MPNILSRLQGSSIGTSDTTGVLKALYSIPTGASRRQSNSNSNSPSYYVTLVEVSDLFKERLIVAYRKDPQQNKVLNLLRSLGSNASIRFSLRDDLIYYTNRDDRRKRLYVPNKLETNIFELTYNRQYYYGFYRSYNRIIRSIYLRYLTKYLRSYIEYYSKYELNQTKRHRLYSALNPINTPSIPFYTITIDFIVTLPTTIEGYDSLLIITDKALKRVLLLPGKTTYTAVDQVNVVLPALIGYRQGIPVAIISNRDAKFISSFQRSLFQVLGIELLTSTAYYPQTNGQSERTNQTVEITLRYYTSSKLTDKAGNDQTPILPYL